MTKTLTAINIIVKIIRESASKFGRIQAEDTVLQKYIYIKKNESFR